jgi:hypothetical protein
VERVSAATGGMVSLLGADPATYEPHPLHHGERVYIETNCYTDVLIELLHARGDEPLAALGFLVRMDFEGDQWTFFKPPPGDLEALFGVDIHEMQPYRPLDEQLERQLAAGRSMMVELDSWFLPDTAATSYRSEHVKTSVAVEAIDRGAERLRYFHNAGFHELRGEDYRGALRTGAPAAPEVLPPYAEIVRFDAGEPLRGAALRAAARERLREHLRRRPAQNPFEHFGAQLADDLPQLLAGDDAGYHAYAFATVRMAGSAFELLGAHLDWLLEAGGAEAAGGCARIAGGCKVLSFKLARRRPFDPSPAVASMAAEWRNVVEALDGELG